MQIPMQHIDEITGQLRVITSNDSDIYRFTRILMRSPDISDDEKHCILKLQSKFVIMRIEEIATGKDVTGPVRIIQNPATLMTLGHLTTEMLDITKPKGNA